MRHNFRRNSIGWLLDDIVNNRLKLEPFKKNRKEWGIDKKCRYIESILVGIPTGNFILTQKDFFNKKIIDGYNRIKTISDFVIDKSFKLDNLILFFQDKNIVNKGWDELEEKYQHMILKYEVHIFNISEETDKNLIKAIYKRVNEK